VPIIRRNNCVYATLGTCYSVWMTVWYAGYIHYMHYIRTYVLDLYAHTNVRNAVDLNCNFWNYDARQNRWSWLIGVSKKREIQDLWETSVWIKEQKSLLFNCSSGLYASVESVKANNGAVWVLHGHKFLEYVTWQCSGDGQVVGSSERCSARAVFVE
jgi:hypothetical protein